MLSNAPKFHEVYEVIINFIGEDIIVGHNINFDMGFIQHNLMKLNHELKNDCIDTLSFCKRINSRLPKYKLCYLCEVYGIKNESAHRAYGDTKATYELYERVKDLINY